MADPQPAVLRDDDGLRFGYLSADFGDHRFFFI
jgi:hypothetical protein